MDEYAKFRYITDRELYLTEKPYILYYTVPGVPSNNIIFQEGPEQKIVDVRGRENDFSLEDYGFTFMTFRAPKGIDWKNETDIEKQYVPVVKELVGELLGGGEMRFEMWEWRVGIRPSSYVFHVP